MMRTANRVLMWAFMAFLLFVGFLILDSYFEWRILS